MNNAKNFLWIGGIVVVLFLISCRAQKEIIYFQPAQDSITRSAIEWKNFPKENKDSIETYDAAIQSNDILNIFVSSMNPEATIFFNPVESRDVSGNNPEILGYIVDSNGEIEIPLIGSVKVAGLTIPVIKDTLRQRLEKYLENPTVRVILDNYHVTVLGEVTKPGIYVVKNERITVPEALGLAGDLTIFGNRRNILVIREEKGKREFATIDITQRNFFETPYFFLHPNDVLYVEPVKAKTASSDFFYRWFPIALSTLTLISVLFVRLKL